MKTALPTVKSGFLSAWMQTPPGTNSSMFTGTPQLASMAAALWHIEFARKYDIQTIELGAAHAPRSANVPPESMADPVAHHVNMETYRNGDGHDLISEDVCKLVAACCGDVTIGTLGAFENLLHVDLVSRRQNLQHIRRAIRAASLMKEMGLGTEGVTIFVGRDTSKTIEENMRLFGAVVIPIIRYAKERSVKIFIENCPMCGWSATAEVFTQNIANVPLHWIIIARMVEAAGLKGWCYLNYDPSHCILQGSRPEWSFQVLARAGYGWFIGRFHGKDLSKQTGFLAMSGALGQRVASHPWAKMNGDQPLPGATHHNPLAMANGLQVDWLGMMIAARLYLKLDIDKIVFTTEFEQSEFRDVRKFASQEQHCEFAGALVVASVDYIRGVDRAAAANVYMRSVVETCKATWSWQGVDPNDMKQFGRGANEVIQQALSWELPKMTKSSDLVIEA